MANRGHVRTTVGSEPLAVAAEGVPPESDPTGADVVHLVKDFVAGIPGRNSGLYVEPDAATRETMTACARLLMARAPMAEVTAMAEPLGYEAIAFYDRVMDRTLSVLRPKPGEAVDLGAHWGLFVFSPQAEIDVVVHAPHPIYDKYSDLMAAQAFQGSHARALFVAGAHRYASGESPPIADVARYVPNVFNDIHCATLKALTPRAVIQFHGYGSTDPSDHTAPDTPATVNLILSAGLTKAELAARPPVAALVEAIKDDLRQEPNDPKPSAPSATFLPNRNWVRGLMGENNEQRKVMRSVAPDVPFLHLEVRGSLRFTGPAETWDAHTTGRLGLALVAALDGHTHSRLS